MTLKTHLFGFMNEPVQEVGQNHKVAAWSLKIECWITFVVAILVAVFGTLIAIGFLVGGAFAGEFIESFGWWDNAGESGAALGALFGVIIFFGVLFAIVLMGLWLWFANTTYMKWNHNEEGAVVWANILGGLLVLFSFGGISNISSGDPSVGTNVISLVIGILILVFANIANSKGELEQGSTASGSAEAA